MIRTDYAAMAELDPPELLTLADGRTVPHAIGTPIFNYYDHRAGTITRLARRGEAQPDTAGILPDGVAWWVDTTAGYVDGSRMIHQDTARARGWMD